MDPPCSRPLPPFATTDSLVKNLFVTISHQENWGFEPSKSEAPAAEQRKKITVSIEFKNIQEISKNNFAKFTRVKFTLAFSFWTFKKRSQFSKTNLQNNPRKWSKPHGESEHAGFSQKCHLKSWGFIRNHLPFITHVWAHLVCVEMRWIDVVQLVRIVPVEDLSCEDLRRWLEPWGKIPIGKCWVDDDFWWWLNGVLMGFNGDVFWKSLFIIDAITAAMCMIVWIVCFTCRNT